MDEEIEIQLDWDAPQCEWADEYHPDYEWSMTVILGEDGVEYLRYCDVCDGDLGQVVIENLGLGQ